MNLFGKKEILFFFNNIFDKNELEKSILRGACELFKADRGYFMTVSKNLQDVPVLSREYLRSPYVKSLFSKSLPTENVWSQLKESLINPPVFPIFSAEKFIKENNFEGSPIEDFLQKSEIKSSYPIKVFEDERDIVYLVVQFVKKEVAFNKSDLELLAKISSEANFAIKQSKAYSNLLQKNKNEGLLVELISLLHSNLDIDMVASEFISRIGNFFESDRCIIRFFNKIDGEFNGYNEFFEYKKDFTTESAKNFQPTEKVDEFLLESEKFHDIIILHDLPYYFKEDFKYKNDIENYLKDNRIKSYLGAFVSYNEKLYGLLGLHYEKLKVFSKNDEEFLKVLANQLGIAIYQSKLYKNLQNSYEEVLNLRKTFLAQLSHELQIPIVAQRNAIEFLLKKNNDEKLTKIIEELKENSNELTDMVKNLMSTYQYPNNKLT